MEFIEATKFTNWAVEEKKGVYLHCLIQNSAGHVLQENHSLLN